MKLLKRLLAGLSLALLLFSCIREEADLQENQLYRIVRADGQYGYGRFTKKKTNEWRGVFYQDNGVLLAGNQYVVLKFTGKKYVLKDIAGERIDIEDPVLYEEPPYEDFPQTWEYRDSVYAVSEIPDRLYGHADGFWVSYPDDSSKSYTEILFSKYLERASQLKFFVEPQDLFMDLYIPEDDGKASRPLLVLIHGGAFFNGDKASIGFPQWARYFAGLGYMVASVNYRLGFHLNTMSIERAGYRAVQDVNAAIRFLVHDKDYRVDPERVFVAGTSAGGITALNIAFMTDSSRPSSTDKLGSIRSVNPSLTDSFSVRAVGNMWGAVNSTEILNDAKSYVVSFHSTGDPVVPYGADRCFGKEKGSFVMPKMYGSKIITEYLGDDRAKLYSFDIPDRHTLHVDLDEETGEEHLNQRFYEIEEAMKDFFSGVMILHPVKPIHKKDSQTIKFDNTDVETVNFKMTGGVILDSGKDFVRVLVFPGSDSVSLIASGEYKTGLTFNEEFL